MEYITFGQYYWKNSKWFLAFVVLTNLVGFIFIGAETWVWSAITGPLKVVATILDYFAWKKVYGNHKKV